MDGTFNVLSGYYWCHFPGEKGKIKRPPQAKAA
nr:MAG TPA: hypothetical protein [Caudoviricetes sp.]